MGKQGITPFLTFNGQAEEAMRFYAAVLPGSDIIRLVRYGKDHPVSSPETENLIYDGAVSFRGQEIIFLDMDASYPAPTFNWAMSLYIDCESEADFDALFDAFSQGGDVMMGPEAVGHIRKGAWVTDKFGVTWQLIWE